MENAPDSTGVPAIAGEAKSPPPRNPRAATLDGEHWKDAARQWAEEDPAGFHAWLVRQDPAPRLEITKQLFFTWVLHDPDAAFTAAVNLPARFQRGEFIPDMLTRLLHAGTYDTKALHWVNKVTDEYSGFTWSDPHFIKNKPPEAAAAMLRDTEAGNYGSHLFELLGRRWAALDPEGARHWLSTLSEERRASALRGVLETWSQKDPWAALGYLAGEATTAERQLIYLPLRELVKTNPAAAFQWWEENMGVPDSNTSRFMLNEWRAQDAQAAESYVLGIEDPILRRQMVQAFVSDMGTEAAKDFALNLPPGPDRNAAVPEISFSWARSDPAGALTWLRAEGESAAAREAVTRMVGGVSFDDPAAGLAWAREVPESLREMAVTGAIGIWREKDAPAAAAAVRTLPDGPVKTAAEQVLLK